MISRTIKHRRFREIKLPMKYCRHSEGYEIVPRMNMKKYQILRAS